jgi:crotonobetainyl-CoA:carnitine CoA-transferase CaiB-like acyl-CoA transferase
MLSGIKILDLTHRLPGPLAGKILHDLGAEVIKVEDEKHRDPFLSGMFSDFDRSFENWYEELNGKKRIVRLDFKSPDIKKQIAHLLESADGLLLSLSPKLKSNLGLDDQTLLGKKLAVVELEASSTHNKAMHDLNALAISGYLSLHVAHETSDIVPPPFLPVAGIAFGQQVATQLLANLIASKKSGGLVKAVSYLHDTADAIFHPFWSRELRAQKKTKFLHNGAYPCYCLYRSKDGHYVALAAVEEKFWLDFIATFNVPLELEKRFNTDPASFRILADTFAKLTANEIEAKASDKELCLSIVRKIS